MTHFSNSSSFTSRWNRRIKLLGGVALLSLAPTLAAQAADPAGTIGSKGWLGFRGDGTSASVSDAPATLDVGDQGNVAWRQAMPGRSVARQAEIRRPERLFEPLREELKSAESDRSHGPEITLISARKVRGGRS